METETFSTVPGNAFVYWVGESTLQTFSRLPSFKSETRFARAGLQTNDDFRWLRLWYEEYSSPDMKLVPFSKGSPSGAFFGSFELCICWGISGERIKSWKQDQLARGEITANNSKCWNENLYGREGITWPTRPHRVGAFLHMPPGCIFTIPGSAIFCTSQDHWALLAVLNSQAYRFLLHLLMPRGDGESGQTLKYEVGYVTSVPIPSFDPIQRAELERLVRESWEISHGVDSAIETSRYFVAPYLVQQQLGRRSYEDSELRAKEIDARLNSLVSEAYGIQQMGEDLARSVESSSDDLESDSEGENQLLSDLKSNRDLALWSWAIGVSFGRFDIRIATGERPFPASADPTQPPPTVSPGMLLADETTPPRSSQILVNEPSSPFNLTSRVESILELVGVPVPADLRRWIDREFFAFHLRRYSKSRRRAPIYWQLSSGLGSYTLWIYYPSLTHQTLYTAINDFVEPKLRIVGADVATLRSKGSTRTGDDEKKFESLQAFELELIELRDAMLKLASTYKPNGDDGVQISAAPLWPLFRHKPWQKILKETWDKLEKGDYDWSHQAMNYWPDRVREKCKTDKSLAIAHGLEHLCVEPEAKPKKNRGRKIAGDAE